MKNKNAKIKGKIAGVELSEKSSISQKLEATRLRREELELKKLEHEIAVLEAGEATSRMTTAQQELMNKEEARKKAQRIEECAHRGGGMDMEGFKNGNGANRCVVVHTYPLPYLPDFPHCTGVHVMCLRCPMDINQGDPEFADAIRWQTKCRPSGNNLFTVTYHQPGASA